MGEGGCRRQDPKPSSPRAAVPGRPGEWPGRRSLTDPGGRHCPPSRGCGRARAVARRAASSGPARAACILPGPAGRGDPPGRRPLCGAGSPQLGTKVPQERGARCGMLGALWGVAGCPCRTWGSLGGGAPSVGRGVPAGAGAGPGPLTRARSPVGRARGSESARGPGRAEVPSCVAVRSVRDSRGGTGVPACGIRDYAGDLGCARSQGCAALQGRAVGQVRRRARRGRGSDLCAQLPPSRAQRGGGRPRGRCPGSAMLLRGREGGREEGGRAARSRAGRGAGAAGAGGGEDPARDAGGGGPRRAGPGRRESGRAPRPGAARRGLMGMAGARSLFSCSLARSLTHARREAMPAAATSQLSKLPSATFSSPPLPAPPPPPSLPLSLACSPPGGSFRARPPEGARAEAPLHCPRWALRCRPTGYRDGLRTGLSRGI